MNLPMTSPCFRPGFERIFGTFPLSGDACRRAVAEALEVGWRAFDTAQMYGNEAEVGDALAASGLAREALCVVTKAHPRHFGAAAFLPSVERSVAALKTGPVDLLLLHWPPVDGDVRPSLEQLAKARDQGFARHVGVSNYTIAMLETAKAVLGEVAVNQVEFHPLLDQSRLLAGATRLGVPLSAYCAMARGKAAAHPVIREIASVYGVAPGQVALRWILQKGVAVNVKTANRARMVENFDLMGFTLAAPDMARIDAIGDASGRIATREIAPSAPDWD